MSQASADRLLSVINGDWSPYNRTRKTCHAPLKWEVSPALVVNEWMETDFELLRHDIHVAVYHARKGESDNVR